MTGIVTYNYTLGAYVKSPDQDGPGVFLTQHDNQLPPEVYNDGVGGNVCSADTPGAVLVSGGLGCDGTVRVNSTDVVGYATVNYVIDGVPSGPLPIINVPFQDAVRTPLYVIYFVNDQVKQITGALPTSLSVQ